MSARLAAMVLSGEEEQLARGVGLRKGQAAFRALEAVDTELADRIRNTAVDPYFDDRRLDAFYVAVGLDGWRT